MAAVLVLDLDGTILEAIDTARASEHRPPGLFPPPDYRVVTSSHHKEVRLRKGCLNKGSVLLVLVTVCCSWEACWSFWSG